MNPREPLPSIGAGRRARPGERKVKIRCDVCGNSLDEVIVGRDGKVDGIPRGAPRSGRTTWNGESLTLRGYPVGDASSAGDGTDAFLGELEQRNRRWLFPCRCGARPVVIYSRLCSAAEDAAAAGQRAVHIPAELG